MGTKDQEHQNTKKIEMSVNNYLYSNRLRDRLLIYNEPGRSILSKKSGEYRDAVLDESFSLLYTLYEKSPAVKI